MLVQFTVENFLSFEGETTFSMVASADQQHPGHVMDAGSRKADRVLRAAAIYGANGAGKSNLIKAVSFAKARILRGARPGQRIAVQPFKLRHPESADLPSKFQFMFRMDGVLYDYGFRLDSERVHEEWLFGTRCKTGAQEKLYLDRSTSAIRKTSITFGQPLLGRGSKRKQRLEFLQEGTRYNQLFLTEAFARNLEEMEPVRIWFEDVLRIIPAEAVFGALAYGAHVDEPFREFFVHSLQAAGTGISGVLREREPLDVKRHLPGKSENELDDLMSHVSGLDGGFLVVTRNQGESKLFLHSEGGQPYVDRLQMQRPAAGGGMIFLSMDEESEGTQRLMHLLPTLFEICENRQRVVLLDELDRRLHPLLSRFVVQAALGRTGESQNQLIFTTHDTNLLDLDLLRRDEIWFVAKNEKGASQVYSLAEFKERPDLRIEKGYLHGRFGAIPFFGNLDDLGWPGAKSDAPLQELTTAGAGGAK